MAIKIDQFSERVKKAMEESLNALVNKDFLNELGSFVVKLVKVRTKLGKGVDKTGGSSTKFEKYSDSYIKERKRLKKKGKLVGTPTKPTLTNTGEMLDKSLDFEVGKNSVEIGMSDDENRKKAEFVSKDRPFLNLSKAELKQIEKLAREEAAKIFKKELF